MCSSNGITQNEHAIRQSFVYYVAEVSFEANTTRLGCAQRVKFLESFLRWTYISSTLTSAFCIRPLVYYIAKKLYTFVFFVLLFYVHGTQRC